nr:MAG TPA: hypothetical protein [Caudoviricetes sp.]
MVQEVCLTLAKGKFRVAHHFWSVIQITRRRYTLW